MQVSGDRSSTRCEPDPAEPAGEAQLAEGWGVNVAGFFRSELGIGEAARGVVASLDAAGVPVVPVHGTYIPGNRQGHDFACVRPEAAPFPINLICINPPELPIFLADAGQGFVDGRHTIGMWWWEVDAFPPRWLPTFDLVDELWVGTEYVASNLRPISKVPVRKMRIPVAAQRGLARTGLPLERDRFLFLFMFDFNSIFERKNPVALVEAFAKAFAPDEPATLVIKSMNHASDPSSHARLLAAAGEHPGVRLISHYLSNEDKNALFAACDCYVSLHRAEGFGLTMAEAMALGKPTIATGYSGNLEFMDDENSFLVDYELVPIQEGVHIYPTEGTWAEPDLDHAAELMRQVFEDHEEAERRATRGERLIRQEFSPQATGSAMAARLRAIDVRGPARASRTPPPRRSHTRPGTFKTVSASLRGRLSLRRTWRAIRESPGQRIALVESFAQAATELARERLRKPGPANPASSGPGSQMWEVLAQLRRQESAIAALRAQVTTLEQRLSDREQ